MGCILFLFHILLGLFQWGRKGWEDGEAVRRFGRGVGWEFRGKGAGKEVELRSFRRILRIEDLEGQCAFLLLRPKCYALGQRGGSAGGWFADQDGPWRWILDWVDLLGDGRSLDRRDRNLITFPPVLDFLEQPGWLMGQDLMGQAQIDLILVTLQQVVETFVASQLSHFVPRFLRPEEFLRAHPIV